MPDRAREIIREHQLILQQATRRPYYHPANGRWTCPYCSHTRKHKKDKCLSYTIREDGGSRVTFDCKHCFEKGAVSLPGQGRRREYQPRRKREEKPEPIELTDVKLLEPEHLEWFTDVRGIDAEVVVDWGIVSGYKWFRKAQADRSCFGFPYHFSGQATAVKWRTPEKHDDGMTQDGSAKTFYGLDHLSENPKWLLITEGEMDALAYATAGVADRVSVPNGAPDKAPDEEFERFDNGDQVKYAYLWHSRDIIERVPKIYISVDADQPGDYLAEELARRIGKAKCLRVRYPDDCNDANDVLMKYGPEALTKCFDEAEPWPISGLNGAEHYRAKVEDLWINGPAKGVGIGIPAVDEIVKWVPGEFYLVTGIPGMGKSEFIDHVTFKTAKLHNWNWGYCSFENPVTDHISKLARKYTEKPFFPGISERMSQDEMHRAVDWIDEHYVFVNQEDGMLPTIDNILELVRAAVLRLGIQGFVLDPFNYINRKASDGVDGVREILTKFSKFTADYDLVGIMAAHPTKLKKGEDGKYPVADGYDVSGAADFFNVPDFGITVHRWDRKATEAEIHNWKTRRQQNGKVGEARVEYSPLTGLYREIPDDRARAYHETDSDY